MNTLHIASVGVCGSWDIYTLAPIYSVRETHPLRGMTQIKITARTILYLPGVISMCNMEWNKETTACE